MKSFLLIVLIAVTGLIASVPAADAGCGQRFSAIRRQRMFTPVRNFIQNRIAVRQAIRSERIQRIRNVRAVCIDEVQAIVQPVAIAEVQQLVEPVKFAVAQPVIVQSNINYEPVAVVQQVQKIRVVQQVQKVRFAQRLAVCRH